MQPLTPPTSPAPSSLPLPVLDNLEVIRVLDPSLHKNDYPYKTSLCSKYRVLDVVMSVYLAYQIITLVVVMICWKGGIYTLFDGSLDNVISKISNHMIICLLQILVRICAPQFYFKQLDIISTSETTLDKKILLKKEDYSLPKLPCKPAERSQRVTLWSTLTHAILFSAIALYLGVFLTIESQFKGNGVCCGGQRLLQLQIPLLGIRLFSCLDSLATFFVLVLIGLVKDCYCIENTLSTEFNGTYFEAIRKRRYRFDNFCYIVSFVVTFLSIVSLLNNQPITPVLDRHFDSDDLEVWCLWMCILSILLYFGSHSNLGSKVFTVACDILAFCCAICFTLLLGVTKSIFPPGTALVILYSYICVTTINFLFCLLMAHYRHKKLKSKLFWFSFLCFVILCVSFCAVVLREVIIFVNSAHAHKN